MVDAGDVIALAALAVALAALVHTVRTARASRRWEERVFAIERADREEDRAAAGPSMIVSARLGRMVDVQPSWRDGQSAIVVAVVNGPQPQTVEELLIDIGTKSMLYPWKKRTVRQPEGGPRLPHDLAAHQTWHLAYKASDVTAVLNGESLAGPRRLRLGYEIAGGRLYWSGEWVTVPEAWE